MDPIRVPVPVLGGALEREESDESLMERIREGAADALQGLMNRHWDGLLGYAGRVRESPDEAEDIAQEVFVRVWQNRARWTAGGSVRAYLYRIARNLTVVERRHEAVRKRTEPEVRRAAPRVLTPVEYVSHEECKAAFEQALRALPDRRREAFTLVRLQGLSVREAAEVMETTSRTTTNHVYMAARNLEEALRTFIS